MTYDVNNKQQEMAYQLIKDTNVSFFLTGKAGTGKTTFLKKIQEEINKDFIVLAPTGIAATMQAVIPSTLSLGFHSVSSPSKR